MKSRGLTREQAINWIKERRPDVYPNSGFRKQLDAYAECGYDPSLTNPAYTKWLDRREKDITDFMQSMVETTTIIQDQLFLNTFVVQDE